MKTLEKLREEYNNLNKKRNAIYRKIVELERQEIICWHIGLHPFLQLVIM